MKAIVCEMCNSQDLIKQDGLYVCQSCGTKYSAEEAKKMMVELDGAVKIDNSDFVQRYLQNARRAMGKEDWAEVEKYYNMVEQNEPDNIEAIFYSAYGKAKVSLTDNDIYKRQAIFKTLVNSVSILDDNYNVEKEAELKEILERITKDVILMFGSEFVFTQTKNGYGNVTGDNKNLTYQLFINLACEMVTTLTNIIAKFPAERQGDIAYILRLRLSLAETLGTQACVSTASRKTWLAKCMEYAKELAAADPSYVSKNYQAEVEKVEQIEKNQTNCGCIIAALVVIGAIVLGVIIGLS